MAASQAAWLLGVAGAAAGWLDLAADPQLEGAAPDGVHLALFVVEPAAPPRLCVTSPPASHHRSQHCPLPHRSGAVQSETQCVGMQAQWLLLCRARLAPGPGPVWLPPRCMAARGQRGQCSAAGPVVAGLCGVRPACGPGPGGGRPPAAPCACLETMAVRHLGSGQPWVTPRGTPGTRAADAGTRGSWDCLGASGRGCQHRWWPEGGTRLPGWAPGTLGVGCLAWPGKRGARVQGVPQAGGAADSEHAESEFAAFEGAECEWSECEEGGLGVRLAAAGSPAPFDCCGAKRPSWRPWCLAWSGMVTGLRECRVVGCRAWPVLRPRERTATAGTVTACTVMGRGSQVGWSGGAGCLEPAGVPL